MTIIGVGIGLIISAMIGINPDWLPRSFEWLGGVVCLAGGYVATRRSWRLP